MGETYPVFVSLRFVINENIDSGVYRILQYMTEWPMIVGEKPEVFENDYFRNDDWANFFANNGTVVLGNFMGYEDMGIEKALVINSYVPNNRKNTIFYFVQWLAGCLEFSQRETVLGYIDNTDSCEIITSKRALPVNFKQFDNPPDESEQAQL